MADFDFGFNNILSSNSQSSNLVPSTSMFNLTSPGGFNPFGGQQQGGGAGGYDPMAMYKMNIGDMGSYGKLAVAGQGLSAFSDLAGLYGAFKALGMQKDALKFQKSAWNKNYANQVQDYENTLKDRWEAKSASAAARGQSYDSMDSYLAPRKLTGT